MDLSKEQTFQINNVVYVLGSPVIPVETLEQLAYSLSQQDISNRPIVIINPQATTIPNFTEMLENYIENYTAGKQQQTVMTSYAFETATDDDIIAFVSQQFSDINSPDAQQQISIYHAIRRQSQIKHSLADYKAEASELWRQHCLNPNSDSGSARYAELTYQLIPQAESELKEVSDLLSRLNTGATSDKSFQQIVENHVENLPEDVPVEDVPEVSEQPQEPEQPDVPADSADTHSMLSLCCEWADAAVKQMPKSAAESIAQSTAYQKFQIQQSVSVPGFKAVELWVLCQLGIRLYPDGVPIVYTTDGKFRRVGESDRSVLDAEYWYPRPIFENYYDAVL